MPGAASAAGRQAGPPVVEVVAGRLSGLRRGAVDVWRGIPYAAPPVGDRRFRAPSPVEPWAGVRPAVRASLAASQSGSLTAPRRRLGPGTGEDCLYLNVTAPSAPAPPRPVLVWIHGGAFSTGSGALYDGRRLAELGDVVVVSINYRLGVFGFVDFATALGIDAPSNLGLRDQIAALTWVRDNIAAFGGDPDRVTVAGESAGSISAALLMCAPSTRGLFRAAVLQSGSYNLVHGPEVHRSVALAYARELGLGHLDAGRLRELPAEQLLAAQVAVGREVRGTTAASPWFDGDLVPASLDEARASTRPDVALLAGHNRDEVTLFQRLPGDIMPTTRPALERRLSAALGLERSAEVLAAYPSTTAGTRELGTDLNFALPTLHLAERHRAAGGPTWFYRFDAAGPVLGATHASELSYLWGWTGPAAFLLRGRLTGDRRALAERMHEHWLRFVREGQPGPDWPAFELPDRLTRVFDPAGDHTEADPSGPRRRLWRGVDVLPQD